MTEARRAIEALRAGVPNRPAIRLLAPDEAELIAAFERDLGAVEQGLGRACPRGQVISGGFGAGKSHVLGYLQELALARNFVVSSVPISKETPLFDADRLFAAAMRHALVAGRADDAMTAIFDRLDMGSPRYAALQDWASAPEAGLAPLFPALLELLPRRIATSEDAQRIARFLAGGKLPVTRVNQWLREAGLKKTFGAIKLPKAADLARQRLAFAPRLMAAAGYAGWCVLLDEVELIGRYGALQRGRSYAELARWLNLAAGKAGRPGIVAVAAFTDDFKDRVIVDRRDDETIPPRLAARNEPESAALATVMIRHLEAAGTLRALRRPDAAALRASLEKARDLYRRAYGWTPPPTEVGALTSTRSMRQHIKSWITGWDLQRLYAQSAAIDVDLLRADYSESADIEKPAEADGDEADDLA
jgi:hypothetical protein